MENTAPGWRCQTFEIFQYLKKYFPNIPNKISIHTQHLKIQMNAFKCLTEL